MKIVEITYYQCDMCKRRHWKGAKYYEEHLPLRNEKFGVKVYALITKDDEEQTVSS